MIEIKTDNLGLAGYIKMHIPLKRKKETSYYFDSEDNVEVWELKYYNCCCARHDEQIMSLRRMKGE